VLDLETHVDSECVRYDSLPCRLLSRGVASNPFTPSIKKGRDEKRIVEASPGIMT